MIPLAENEHLFTSESVTEGHPDKMADQIFDAALAGDPASRVACETLITTGLVVLVGEITLDRQSPDIAQGVEQSYETCLQGRDIDTDGAHSDDELDAAGAGDQGMMFGFACRETPELMPLPIALAHRLARRLAAVRKDGTLGYLRPDGKTQVTVRYRDGKPVGVEKLLISTQHAEEVETAQIKKDPWEHVVVPEIPLTSTRTRSWPRTSTSTRPDASSSANPSVTPA